MRSRLLLAMGLAFCCLALSPGRARAEPLVFEFSAEVFPTGDPVTGSFSYDPASVNTIGSTEYFPTANSTISVDDGQGFQLTLPVAYISVQPGATTDFFFLQTFQSEQANDWHIVIEISAPGGSSGWLMGDSSLPAAFPDSPDTALLHYYFTDEFSPVTSTEAALASIIPVPEPGSLALLAPAVTLLATRRTRATRG